MNWKDIKEKFELFIEWMGSRKGIEFEKHEDGKGIYDSIKQMGEYSGVANQNNDMVKK